MKSNKFGFLKTYIIITFGLFLIALGLTAFLIPAGIVGGGASGAGTLIYFMTGFPVGMTFLIVNVFLLLLAIKMLGASFGIKTIYGVLVLSFLFSFLQLAIKGPIVKDAFMASIIGGILGGVGVGIVFTQGGSTGGTDIIAMIIRKYRNISPGRIIMMVDVFIISSSYLVFGSLEKIVYGYVTMAVTSYAIDMILEGSKLSIQVFVFSNNNELIAERIGNELGRGITFLKGKGWYTNEERDILMVIARKNEISLILRMVKELDEEAFISIATVMGVFGKGFEKIRY
ncbi:MAG: YitT family protein [Ignavibacteriales bacterium]